MMTSVFQKLVHLEAKTPHLGVLFITTSRVVSLLLSMISVPLLLGAFPLADYSLWVVVYSLISWLTYFDFGIGYALRNEMSKLRTAPEDSQFRTAVGSVLVVQFLIAFVALSIFLISLRLVSPFRDDPLVSVLLLVPAILLLPVGIHASIVQGLRLTGIYSLAVMVKQLWIVAVLGLVLYKVSLTIADVATLVSLFAVLSSGLVVILSRSVFRVRIRLRSLFLAASYLSIGGKFFLLQLTGLVLFSMGNYIAFLTLSPFDVARYDGLNKLYTAAMTLFNGVSAVLWGHLSEALQSRDRQRFTRHLRTLDRYLVLFAAALAISIPFVPTFFTIWTGGKLHVGWAEVIAFAGGALVQAFAFRGAVVMNVLERLWGQIWLSLFAVCLFVCGVYLTMFHSDSGQMVLLPLVGIISILPLAAIVNVWARRVQTEKFWTEPVPVLVSNMRGQ